MLKGIPKELTPEMLKILSEMGHGDYIVVADAHFPASSYSDNVIHYNCINAPDMIRAILQVMPLDNYVDEPIHVMSLVQSDVDKGMPIPDMWQEVWSIANKNEVFEVKLGEYERFQFYDVAKGAFAIIQTGETRQYGNFILQKGVVKE